MNLQEWYIPRQIRGEKTETIQSLSLKIRFLEDKGDNFAQLGNLYFQLGKLYQHIEYYQQAINAFNISLQNFQTANEYGIDVGFVHQQLGRTYIYYNAREQAIESLRISLSLFEADPKKCVQQEIDVYNLLGACFNGLGDSSQARQYFQMAIYKTIAQKQNKIHLCNSLINLSMINSVEGNTDDAIKGCLSALKILKENYRSTSNLSLKLVQIYFTSRRYKEGLTEILKNCNNLFSNGSSDSLEYVDYRDRVFRKVLTAMKEVKDKAGRELIEAILVRHYKEQDLLIDYIQTRLGREKKMVNSIEELA